jgi:allantoin racemase
MEICVVHVNCEDISQDYTALLTKNFDRVKRPDTVVKHKYVEHLRRATDTVFAFPILLNKLDVIKRMVEAAGEGADGIMVACSGDPGVVEARTLVDVPVVGPMEATLHLAATYGKKIGIVTVMDPSWREYCETITEMCGLGGRLAGIESISVPSTEAFTKGFRDMAPIGQSILEAAERLIARGANTIVLGSAGLSTMAAALEIAEAPGRGVPVFDVLSTGLKLAELKVDLSRSLKMPAASRVGMLERMDAKNRDRLVKLFNLPWTNAAESG